METDKIINLTKIYIPNIYEIKKNVFGIIVIQKAKKTTISLYSIFLESCLYKLA